MFVLSGNLINERSSFEMRFCFARSTPIRPSAQFCSVVSLSERCSVPAAVLHQQRMVVEQHLNHRCMLLLQVLLLRHYHKRMNKIEILAIFNNDHQHILSTFLLSSIFQTAGHLRRSPIILIHTSHSQSHRSSILFLAIC